MPARNAGVAFQRALITTARLGAPPRTAGTVPLGVMVDDLAVAEARVISLGARPLRGGDHVYADLPDTRSASSPPRPGHHRLLKRRSIEVAL
jgi:hypothetical protein